MLRRTAAAILAGLLLSLAFEPVAVPYVVPFAVAAFALITRGLRARAALVPGLAFGAAFFFTHIWWMKGSIGIEAWIALSITETVFYGLLGAASAPLQRLRAWPFWLAAAWTTMEVVRSTQPLSGMPWGRLAFAAVDTPVAPVLPYVGMNGLSFLLATMGFLLARLVVSHGATERLSAAASLTVIVAVTVTPVFVPFELTTTGQTTIAAIQGDVPGPGNNVLYDPRGLTANHTETTIRLAQEVADGEQPAPDFVVWPENSTAVDPFRDPVVNDDIQRALAAVGVPILVGGLVDQGPDELLNQGIVWDPVTGPGERYTKQNPVPYGEYIPWRDQMPDWFLSAGRLDEIGRDMQAGHRTTPLEIAGVQVADAICFDVAYDAGIARQIENGAEVVVVQTSNASFIFTDQIDQQFAMTRLRAMETGKYLVVASTNGISGIVAPDGSVLDSSTRLTSDILVETVDLKDGVTPGLRVGAVLAWLLPLLTVVGLALSVLLARRPYRRTAPAPQSAPESTTASPEPPA